MKVKFIPSEEFMRQFKRLAKKYPSLVSDYDTFKKDLHENPFQGSDLGSGVSTATIINTIFFISLYDISFDIPTVSYPSVLFDFSAFGCKIKH